MTFGELKRELAKNGCRFHHEGGNHEMWVNPKTGKLFPVGRHNSKEIKNAPSPRISTFPGFCRKR